MLAEAGRLEQVALERHGPTTAAAVRDWRSLLDSAASETDRLTRVNDFFNRRIRFDEWPLLLLRLLLLAMLALWLARPVLTGVPDTTPWMVVAPGAGWPIAS